MKVIDKRMFTPDGRLREGFEDVDEAPRTDEARSEATVAAPEAPVPETRSTRPAAERSEPPEASGPARPPLELPDAPGGLGAPTFYDLIGLLAEPISLYLGDLKLPDGASAENLDLARMHIDLLALLRQKTAGNLTAQEAGVMEDLLYRLRMRYIQKRG